MGVAEARRDRVDLVEAGLRRVTRVVLPKKRPSAAVASLLSRGTLVRPAVQPVAA